MARGDSAIEHVTGGSVVLFGLGLLFVLPIFAALLVAEVVVVLFVLEVLLLLVGLQEVLAQAFLRFLRREHGFQLANCFSHFRLV